MNPKIEEFQDAVAATPPETYYHVTSKEYLVHDAKEDWISFSENQYKRFLRNAGLSARVNSNERLSAQDAAILKIQTERNINYAGPLAGWSKGYYEIGATRILVTTSPRIIESREGKWPTIHALVYNLLGDRNNEQLPYFLGWLKIAYESLKAGRRRPGQAVAFCGCAQSGKSLLQKLLTEILGGRVAKPFQGMMGSTPFNSDWFKSEHLAVEDEVGSSDPRARRSFGAQIKNITVNEVQRLHEKHKDALVLNPFWRLSISLNIEDENVQVLPMLDESIADKLMLFKALKHDMPMPTGTNEERETFWNQLVSELPAFLYHLEQMPIPTNIQCPRFGVLHYHHPDIVHILDASAPETKLLALIDLAFFSTVEVYAGARSAIQNREIELSAAEIESHLTQPSATCSYECRRLLSWNNACGTYLGRLAQKQPHRVCAVRTAENRRWRISAPAIAGTE